jgi:hypothetical protein
VPLLINDRVDVALAVGCEGVHIGQDDMGAWGLYLFIYSTPERSILTDRRTGRGKEAPRAGQDYRSHGQHRRGGAQGVRGRGRLSRHRHRLCHPNVRDFDFKTCLSLVPDKPQKDQHQGDHRRRWCA